MPSGDVLSAGLVAGGCLGAPRNGFVEKCCQSGCRLDVATYWKVPREGRTPCRAVVPSRRDETRTLPLSICKPQPYLAPLINLVASYTKGDLREAAMDYVHEKDKEAHPAVLTSCLPSHTRSQLCTLAYTSCGDGATYQDQSGDHIGAGL